MAKDFRLLEVTVKKVNPEYWVLVLGFVAGCIIAIAVIKEIIYYYP